MLRAEYFEIYFIGLGLAPNNLHVGLNNQHLLGITLQKASKITLFYFKLTFQLKTAEFILLVIKLIIVVIKLFNRNVFQFICFRKMTIWPFNISQKNGTKGAISRPILVT